MYLEENLKLIKNSKLDIELLKRQNDILCQENNTKIEGLQDIILATEKELETDLKESGEKKVECKLGWCSYRSMPDKWDYDIPKLIKWAKEDETFKERYIKVIEEIKKDVIKKDIGSGFLIKELPGITVTSQDPKFNYKISGGI